eukprot:3264678-Amphidinium_carterae.1
MPRPSQAPSMPEADLVLPEAATASPLVYSPLVTPDPQEVNSSSGSDSEYSGHTLLTELQKLASATEMSPYETAQFWDACNDAKVHDLLAPSWVNMLKQHSLVHVGSESPSMERERKVLRWYHSTSATQTDMLSRGTVGSRYVFSSPAACGLHRI